MEMKNIGFIKIKIIEGKTPEKAEYEINDFIKRCKQNNLQLLDISSHVNLDADGVYCYTFIVKYRQITKQVQKVWNDERW